MGTHQGRYDLYLISNAIAIHTNYIYVKINCAQTVLKIGSSTYPNLSLLYI